MNQILKDHILSAVQTFLATFLLVAGTTLQSGVEWTAAFWASLALVAGRAALKEVFAKFAPISFGGRVGVTALGRRN